MEYELELTDKKSLKRIQDFFQSLYNVLRIQNEDSFEGINGGASVHYEVKIKVKEEWV